MPVVPLEAFLDKANNQNSPFDYLIVGGGSTGLVIANRLSENPNVTVGVIEAGAYHAPSGQNSLIDTPGYMGRAMGNPLYDWAFQSEPQPNAKNESIYLPRGKGLGGSSIINYMGLTRPSKEEYDALETNWGNRGWTWDNLLECMKKSETFSQHSATDMQRHSNFFRPVPDPSVHGTNGPIHLSYAASWPLQSHTPEATQEPSSSSDLFFKTLEEFGVPANPEPCNGNIIGFAKFLMTIEPDTCTRSSSVAGYFDPIAGNRNNLFVLTDAQVTRVLLETSNKSGNPRAVGVEIYMPETQKRVEVRNIRREVIISTGTFQTPEILEGSGIGDSTLLKQQGVEPFVNLPGVGNNLQDHISICLIAEIDPKYETGEILFDPVELKKHEDLYCESKHGMLTSSLAQSLAFVSLQHVSDITGTSSDALVKQLKDESKKYLKELNLPQEVQRGIESQYELQEKFILDKNQATIELMNVNAHLPTGPGGSMPDIAGKKRYTSLVASLLRPFSRGTSHRSPESSTTTGPQHPKIDPKVFSHPLDLPLLLRGAEYILRMTLTEPLKGALGSWVFPPELSTINLEKALQPDSGSVNEERARLHQVLDDHIRSWYKLVYHPVGTAAMMPREDGGVVDSRLQVYGVDGLRVADLSVIPFAISAHTVSAAYAIGEMAANILKRDLSNDG